MNITRLLLAAPFVLVAVACGGTNGETSQSSDPNSPESFCSRQCIPEDQDRCQAFTSRFNGAFLSAFEACGDNPKCIEPKLDAAARTDRQNKLAADYCAQCSPSSAESCATKFFVHDQSGGPIASLSDSRLDQIADGCLPKLEGQSTLTCELEWTTCVLPFLQEDLKGDGVICRQRR